MAELKRCPGCPQVPVVSEKLARTVLKRVAERGKPLIAALQWLVQPHEGLEVYLGVVGREYTQEERDAIAVETQAAAALPCPFQEDGQCMIGGLGPHYNRVEETGQAPYGWLPTLVAREWAIDDFRGFVRSRQVADVKVALMNRNEGFLSRDEQGNIYVG